MCNMLVLLSCNKLQLDKINKNKNKNKMEKTNENNKRKMITLVITQIKNEVMKGGNK